MLFIICIKLYVGGMIEYECKRNTMKIMKTCFDLPYTKNHHKSSVLSTN